LSSDLPRVPFLGHARLENMEELPYTPIIREE
jgi:hypothetical protein